jgi:hypothetical protein
MPAGAGPVGGAFGAIDYVGPQVINISPPPGSTLQSPKPVIEFDVIDYENGLNPLSVRARVNGLAVFDNGQAQKFFSAWAGTAAIIPLGVRVVMQAPDFLGSAAAVSVDVFARDVADNRVKKSWTFRTYPATGISSFRLIGARCIDLTFTPRLRVNGELYRPSNYAFSVRLGYAKDLYARAVVSPSDTPEALVSSVTVCMRDYFSRNGRYTVRVQGVIDEFGRVVDTGGPL